MEETVLYISDNMRCWNSAKPGFWKFGTYLGRIAVTNQRFIFLSSGSSKMGSIMATGFLAGPLLGPLIIGKSLTKDLALDALKNEGSFEVTLNEITSIEAIRRWDLAGYLTIQFNHQGRSFIKDPFGTNLSNFRDMVELVEIGKIKLLKA